MRWKLALAFVVGLVIGQAFAWRDGKLMRIMYW